VKKSWSKSQTRLVFRHFYDENAQNTEGVGETKPKWKIMWVECQKLFIDKNLRNCFKTFVNKNKIILEDNIWL
jgi:hypothetical protein